MADSHIQQCIEWLNWYSQQYGAPQKDPSAVVRLIRATADYLNWMKSVNYSLATQHLHRRQLELFLDFVKNRCFQWQQLFTVKTRELALGGGAGSGSARTSGNRGCGAPSAAGGAVGRRAATGGDCQGSGDRPQAIAGR